MRRRLVSTVVVLAVALGIMVVPAGASALGLVVEPDASAPVGVEAFVRGVVPDGASGVRTEVLVGDEWVDSEVGLIGDDGGFEIVLSFGDDTLGEFTYRVVADVADGEVSSEPFVFTRTAASEKPEEPEEPEEPEVLHEPEASSVVVPAVEEFVAAADPDPVTVTVTATNVASRPVGVLTRVWGRVNGYPGGQVFTEVSLAGGWSRSQVTTSDPTTGYYQIPLTYGASRAGTYTYRVGASTLDGPPVYSSSFTITRTATVSASNVASRPVGALTRVWGRVNGQPRGRVFTEVMTSNGWSRSQTVTSDASGSYQIPLTYGASTAGTYTWRVGADTAAGRVYSNTFTLIRTPPPPPPPPRAGWNGRALNCGAQLSGKAVMVDKRAQRAWLCRNGAAVSGLLPFTAGPTFQARQGVYRVFFKRNPHSSLGARPLRLDHFTGFTRGVNGNRIGFHKYVNMPESQVGSEAYRNRSGGCFRMRARDAQLLYQFTDLGTTVHVLTNG